MALKTVKYRVDDLELQQDPGNQVPGAKTIPFAVLGDEYEIDLTEANSEALLDALSPFIKAARRIRHGKRPRRRPAPGAPGLREWARQQGYAVKDAGRVPDAIVREYEAAVS